MTNNNISTLSAVFWKLFDNFGAQLVSFIVQIILARILFPSDYSIIALTTVFITIANVFVQTGFTTAIIQKENVSDLQLNSIFIINVALSIFLYALMYVFAPSIASFYNVFELTTVLRIQSILILFGGFSSVHNALLIRNLEFRKIFKFRILSLFVQGLFGILLALFDYGVWALVVSSLTGNLIISLSYWKIVDWTPKFTFSFIDIKSIFSYSSRILFSSLINVLYENIKSLIIGKAYSPSTLAFYNRGIQIPTLLMVNTDGAINTVIFPVLSKVQNDRVRILDVYRKSIRLTCYIVFPMLIGIIIIAEPFTRLILTEKWIESVPFMILYSAICMTWPFSIRFQALNAIGRSDLSVLLNLVEKAIGITVLILTLSLGIYQFVLGFLIVSIINVFIGSYVINKEFSYNYKDQIFDVGDSLILSLAMLFFLNLISDFIFNPFLQLVVPVFVGIFIYIFGSILIKHDSLIFISNQVKSTIKNINVA